MASVGLMHNLSKMMVIPDSAGDARLISWRCQLIAHACIQNIQDILWIPNIYDHKCTCTWEDKLLAISISTRHETRMGVSIYDSFGSNLGINEYLNPYHYHWSIRHTLPVFLYAWISTRVSVLRITNSLPPPLTAKLLWTIICKNGPDEHTNGKLFLRYLLIDH